MVCHRTIRKRTNSKLLMKWYIFKKRDEKTKGNSADKIDLEKENEFKEFCSYCAIKDNCEYNKDTCPYWQEYKNRSGNK